MRPSPITPTVFTGSNTANTWLVTRYKSSETISSKKISSQSRRMASRSGVISPMTRTARPGPGNGCRQTICGGSASTSPRRRTSSLKRSRSGSMSWNPNSAGSPPTLWCNLMLAAVPARLAPLSMTSGYRVPCANQRAFAPISLAAAWKTLINRCPIRRRFSCGSVMPSKSARNSAEASITRRSTSNAPRKVLSTKSRSPVRNNPLSTKMHVN